MNPDLVDDIDGGVDSDLSAPTRSRGCDRVRQPGDSRPRRRPQRARRVYRRRRIKAAIALVLAVFIIWTGVSLGGALLNPALGSSFASRFSEWAREHGGASIVNWVEKEWYSHHPPPIGGKPPAGAIPRSPQVAGPGGIRAPPSAATRADRALGQPRHLRRGPVVAGRTVGGGSPGDLRDHPPA